LGGEFGGRAVRQAKRRNGVRVSACNGPKRINTGRRGLERGPDKKITGQTGYVPILAPKTSNQPTNALGPRFEAFFLIM
jgi:hypothetical protein